MDKDSKSGDILATSFFTQRLTPYGMIYGVEYEIDGRKVTEEYSDENMAMNRARRLVHDARVKAADNDEE